MVMVPTVPNTITPAIANGLTSSANGVGILTKIVGATGTVQASAVVTLATAQWDAVTGQVGGLTSGATYYVSPTSVGNLTTTPPEIPGAFTTQVGVALNTTDLLLEPSVPVRDLVIAAAQCDGQVVGGGFITQRGFSGFVHAGTGEYSLTLAGNPPPDNNCIVNVTLFNQGGLATLDVAVNVTAKVSGGVVEVFIYNPVPSPAGVNSNFYVTVTNNT